MIILKMSYKYVYYCIKKCYQVVCLQEILMLGPASMKIVTRELLWTVLVKMEADERDIFFKIVVITCNLLKQMNIST